MCCFRSRMRTGLDLRNRYAEKGGFSAVVIKLRLPDGRIYGQDGTLDYVSPTVGENTDTITLRGVIANPVFPGMKAGMPGSRELMDGEFVTVMLEGVQPISGSGHSARRGAVRPARRLRLCRRCAEQGAAAAHPARPVDPVHRRRDQRAQGGRVGHQRGAAAGPPRRSRFGRPGKPAAVNPVRAMRGATRAALAADGDGRAAASANSRPDDPPGEGANQ